MVEMPETMFPGTWPTVEMEFTMFPGTWPTVEMEFTMFLRTWPTDEVEFTMFPGGRQSVISPETLFLVKALTSRIIM